MPVSNADAADWQKMRGMWRQEPVLYAQQRLGMNPSHQQAKIMNAVAKPGAKVTVRAGHGLGKSSTASALGWWFLECMEFPKVPCTAPTAAQLHQVLWSELSKWLRKSDLLSAKSGLPNELWLSSLFDLTATRIADKGSPNEWFAVARTSRRENPDALQGFHASNVMLSKDGKAVATEGEGGSILFIIEEASGVPEEVFVVAEGALSSHGARLLMIGNPTKNTGYFARSHKQDRASFDAMHFRCDDSPLVDPNYRPNLVRKFGEGSNVVRVRADGEFPKQDDDVLIPLELAEAALTREKPAEARTERRRLGVDVARFGTDRTVLVLRQGPVIEHIEVHSREDTTQTTGRIITAVGLLQVDDILVDEIGVGAGVVDMLRQAKRERRLPEHVRVIAVNVAGTSPQRTGAAGGNKKTDAIGRLVRDYLWLMGKRWLEFDEPVFAADKDNCEDLAGELSMVCYKHDSNGFIAVESKDDMKKSNEGRSPDIADAMLLTLYDGSVGLHAPVGIDKGETPRALASETVQKSTPFFTF